MARSLVTPLLLVGALALPVDADAKPRKRRRVDSKSVKKKAEPAKPAPPPAAAQKGEASTGKARPPDPEMDVSTRIEFDERLVGGQTAKPGTVRLFERRESDLESMVRTRRRFRASIVRSILGTDPAPEVKR